MPVKIGDKVPEISLQIAGSDGPISVSTSELFANKRIALFALPGAFTPTCSAKHLPGYLENEKKLKSEGIDEIICLSVNDAFVMSAWARSLRVKDRITMLCDGNAELVRAFGLEFDATRFGMGVRSQRFSMIIENGEIENLWVENAGEFLVSSAEHMIANIK